MIRAWMAPAGMGLALAAGQLTPEQSRSAGQKLQRIMEQKLAPGASVILSQDELNSYLRYDGASELPPGLSKPQFHLEKDRVRASAWVDFLEWKAATGSSPGPVLSWLLKGKRRVEAVCRYTSADGWGQVDIERVVIGGVPVAGSAVTFLIERMVQPSYPDAVVGRRTKLGYNLRQVRVESGRAVVTSW